MDYGISVAKQGKSATSKQLSDLVMNTKYPFAKIDQTNNKSFLTTTITVISDPPAGTSTEIYRFEHGYKYMPQVWGLWNIQWSASLGGLTNIGYGDVSSSTSPSASTVYYRADSTYLRVIVFRSSSGSPVPSLIGTTFTLTTYIFVDDTTNT